MYLCVVTNFEVHNSWQHFYRGFGIWIGREVAYFGMEMA